MRTTSPEEPLILLVPNFGGEEGVDWGSLRADPTHRRTRCLWSEMFGASTAIAGDENSPSVRLFPESDRPAIEGLPTTRAGVSWLATADSWHELERSGFEPWGARPDVVAKVHDKAFARRVSTALRLDSSPAAHLFAVLGPDDFTREGRATDIVRGALETWPEWARCSWTLKPRFGSSGRGRVPGFGFEIDSPQFRGSLARLAERGGAILEPFLDRSVDLSAQFFVHGPDRIELLGTLRQNLTVSGSYLGHEGVLAAGAIRSGEAFDDELIRTSRELVRSAANVGFIGPCGVDAFVFEHGREPHFRPCVEFNARFTLGTIVVGLIRRLLAANAMETRTSWGPARFRFHLNEPDLGDTRQDTPHFLLRWRHESSVLEITSV